VWNPLEEQHISATKQAWNALDSTANEPSSLALLSRQISSDATFRHKYIATIKAAEFVY
jgi:hypothetical protein